MLVFSFLLIARLSFLSAAMRLFFLYVPRLQVLLSAAFLLVLLWGSHAFIMALSGARIIPHKHGIHHICYTSKTWGNDQRWSAKSWITILFFSCILRENLYFCLVCSVKQLGIMTYQGDWLWSTPLSWKCLNKLIFAGWNKLAAYVCAVFNNFE